MDFYNKGDIAGLTLSQEEKSAYAILYAKAEPSSNGSISANQAFNFLTKSKLPFEILSEIWKQTQKNSALDREGFYKALKYVALAQNNQPVNPHLLYASTPLPVFEGIYLNNNTNVNTNSRQDINNLTISDIEYEKWSNLFYQSKPVNNNISGNVAKDIFLKSGLSTSVLAEVWQLVDLEKSGELDLNEFLVAMFIIMRLKDNTIREVPRAIPSNLWKSVAYNKNSSNFGTFSNRTQRFNSVSSNNDNSFSNNFSSSVTLNRTGGNPVPVNVTGGNSIPLNVTGGSSIPVNMTGGSININKTGGSVVSVNKTGGSIMGVNRNEGSTSIVNRNNMLMSSGVGGYKNNSFDNSLNNFNSQSILSNQSSNQSINSNYGNDYAITPQEKEKYDQLFNKLDTMGNQYVTGEQSMDFFLKSGLSTPDLAQIWELADMNKVGRLTREEFYIAMHLIRQKKSGMQLPTTLPTCLIPPSLRKGSVSSIGGNSQLGQPMSASFSNTPKLGSDPLISSLDSSANKFPSSTSNNNNMSFSNLRSPSGNNTMENEVKQLKSEIQQMDNSILSMNNDKQLAKNQRDQLEQELKELVSKKNDLSMKLTQLKISCDSENLMLNDLKTTVAKENQTRENAQAECNQLEEMVKKLRNEKMFIEHDIERSKEEVSQLNNRIKELKNEYSTLKEEVDRLASEQKHQNDMLNVTRQMTMAEQQKVDQLKQDKMNLQVSIMNNQKELDKSAAERNARESTAAKQESKIVNPFEQEDESDLFSNDNAQIKPSKVKSAFDDAFDALSARATSINSGRFEASFDDAFGTSNQNQSQGQTVNAFDDAFQVPGKERVASPTPADVFDDAFQVPPANVGAKTNNNAFDDPFSKHAQSIPNAFDDAFKVSDKKGSTIEDPFASNSNLPSANANAFDDAFTVPSNSKKEASKVDSYDDAFKVNPGSNVNSPFINASGFDNAFQPSTPNKAQNNQNTPDDFGADFDHAFDNNNNAFEDPFKAADEVSSTPNQAPPEDKAGFSFDHAVIAAQEQSFSFENTPVSAPGKDQAGFSFDTAFETSANPSTTTNTAALTTDPFKVSSPEVMTAEDIQTNEEKEDNDSSLGEENEIENSSSIQSSQQPTIPVEEISNPFGDDQNIEEDEEYIEEDEEDDNDNDVDDDSLGPEAVPEQPQETPISMPMPVSMPEPTSEQVTPYTPEPQEPQEQQPQQELPPEEPISMPMPMPVPVDNSVSESVEPEEQPPVENKTVETVAANAPASITNPATTAAPVPEQIIEEVIVEEIIYEEVPPEQIKQQQQQQPIENVQEKVQEETIVPESLPTPVPEQVQESNLESLTQETSTEQQPQPQEEQVQPENSHPEKSASENPFENENNVVDDENAFETDFNNAFQNMAITNDSQSPTKVDGNDTNLNESQGNMIKTLSNNSIKIDNIDMDKEFQDFVNNSTGFEQTETNETSIVTQNVNDGVNNSFDEEFETGFDENDFNFDTTFDNKNVSFSNEANTNTNTNESKADPFDTFAEQATAHFDTNFDDAFNFDNFYPKNGEQQKPTDAFMDEAFGGSTNTPATGDNTDAFANFDNNFNDFSVNDGDPFAAAAAFEANANAKTSTTTSPTNAVNPTTQNNEASTTN